MFRGFITVVKKGLQGFRVYVGLGFGLYVVLGFRVQEFRGPGFGIAVFLGAWCYLEFRV